MSQSLVIFTLIKSAVCDDYYNVGSTSTFEDAESFANSNGMHLSSIHSSEQNHKVHELCSTYNNLQSKICCIGLQTNAIDNDTISMSWIDDTDIFITFHVKA